MATSVEWHEDTDKMSKQARVFSRAIKSRQEELVAVASKLIVQTGDRNEWLEATTHTSSKEGSDLHAAFGDRRQEFRKPHLEACFAIRIPGLRLRPVIFSIGLCLSSAGFAWPGSSAGEAGLVHFLECKHIAFKPGTMLR